MNLLVQLTSTTGNHLEEFGSHPCALRLSSDLSLSFTISKLQETQAQGQRGTLTWIFVYQKTWPLWATLSGGDVDYLLITSSLSGTPWMPLVTSCTPSRI